MNSPSRRGVDVQFLAAEHCFDRLLLGLQRLNVQPRFVDRTIGFAEASVPCPRLLEALDLSGAQYVSVPRNQSDAEPVLSASERKLGPPAVFTLPIVRVADRMPQTGPYFPAQEAGLSQLWQLFPEADGRGTRIAIVDDGFDLLHPGLLQVNGDGGPPLPKVADIEIAAIPDDFPGWVQFDNAPLHPDHGQAMWGGRPWKVPEGGTYSIGVFAMNLRLGSAADPTAPVVTLAAGVLWDRARDVIWVDTDGDGDFTNNRPLTDYAKSHDVDFFGNARDRQDNRIPFAAKIDHDRSAVYLEIGLSHGMFVAGTAAANRLSGGLFDGAAPQAQIIDVRRGSAAVPAMIKAAARPDVDVVNRSGAVGVLGSNQGFEEFERRALERLLRDYKKPIVCVCTVAGSINVGDYQSPQMLEQNRQLAPPLLDSINHIAWFNPAGIENSVIAPSTAITTESRYAPVTYVDSTGKTHFGPALFNAPAPAGYAVGANPSPTVSLVSGMVADLISLAKEQHIRYDATRIADAVLTGTSLVSGFPAATQGHGLVNALRAWRQLEAMSGVDDPNNPVLTNFEVRLSADSGKATVYGFSEFVAADRMPQERRLWVRRRGGFPGARRYQTMLRASDGTFELLEQEVTLQRDHPVRIRFAVRPTPGFHVTYLQLIDADSGVAMHEIPLELRMPDAAEHPVRGVERYQVTVGPRRVEWSFIQLKEELQAMRITKEMPDVGFQVSPAPRLLHRGIGRLWFLQKLDTDAAPSVDPADHDHVLPRSLFAAVVASPPRGTWEVDWDNRGRAEYETKYASPAPQVPITGSLLIEKYSLSIGRAGNGKVRVHNRLAGITGRIEFLESSVQRRRMRTHGSHGIGMAETEIPPGTAAWRVAIEGLNTPRNPLDLYVLNCAESPDCVVAEQQAMGQHHHTLSVMKPQPGRWRIVVMRRGHGGTATYVLREALLKARKQYKDAPSVAFHPGGEQWYVRLPQVSKGALRPSYAAFRIVEAGHMDGDLIALTPIFAGRP